MANVPNNPLTKFPLSARPPGASTLSSPNHTSILPHPIAHSPIGPIAIGAPVQVTPIATRMQFGGGNITTPVAKVVKLSR